MNEDIVKIGRVSSIDYKTGMIQVLYEDLSDEDDVSDYLPYMTFNREYAPPEIGEFVVVFGMSNDINGHRWPRILERGQPAPRIRS